MRNKIIIVGLISLLAGCKNTPPTIDDYYQSVPVGEVHVKDSINVKTKMGDGFKL